MPNFDTFANGEQGLSVRTKINAALTYLSANTDNWTLAFSWGDHSVAGYATSAELAAAVTNSPNWDTAFGWGDHALVGYITSAAVADLTDVDLTGLTANDFLQWDGASWVPSNPPSIDDITDVVITSPTTGQVLRYDGTNWLNATLVKADISDFSDADYATALQGALADTAIQPGDTIPSTDIGSGAALSTAVLTADGVGGSVYQTQSLGDHDDVTVSPAADDILYWDGAEWSSKAPIAADVAFTPSGDIVATNVQGAIEELDTEKLPAASLSGGLQNQILTKLSATDQDYDWVTPATGGSVGVGTTESSTLRWDNTGSAWVESTDALLSATGDLTVTGAVTGSNLNIAAWDAVAAAFPTGADTQTVRFNGTTLEATSALVIDASGNVSIGDAGLNGRQLSVGATGGNAIAEVIATTSGNAYVDIISEARSLLRFGDSANSNIGKIEYEHTGDSMFFVTNATEAMRIASDGSVWTQGWVPPTTDGRFYIGLDDAGLVHSYSVANNRQTGLYTNSYTSSTGQKLINDGTATAFRGICLSDNPYFIWQLQAANGLAGEDVTFTTPMKLDAAGLDVTGNITVSGTVDGRDIAVDGAKLDTFALGFLPSLGNYSYDLNLAPHLPYGRALFSSFCKAAEGAPHTYSYVLQAGGYSNGGGGFQLAFPYAESYGKIKVRVFDYSSLTWKSWQDLHTSVGANTTNGNHTVTGELYANSWVRSSGNQGWYSQTYGGGIHMQDTTYVRVYGSKQFYVANSITATGNVTAYSDVRLKANIETLPNALDKVMAMRGVEYDRIDRDYQHEVGVIAQEVLEVLPDVVTYNKEDDRYGVDYGRITAVLIEAIKEQQNQIDALKEQINDAS